MKKVIFLVALMSILYYCPTMAQDEIIQSPDDKLSKLSIDDFGDIINNANDTYCMYVTADILNVRDEPNTDANISGQLYMNMSVDAIGEVDGWTCILEYDDTKFVKSDYLSEEQNNFVPLGNFKITHYCCEKYKHICGEGYGITRSGTPVRPGVISVDPKVIPLGSKVMINGQTYVAEDTGGMIKGNIIDMAVETHKEALNLGIYHADVYLITE